MEKIKNKMDHGMNNKTISTYTLGIRLFTSLVYIDIIPDFCFKFLKWILTPLKNTHTRAHALSFFYHFITFTSKELNYSYFYLFIFTATYILYINSVIIWNTYYNFKTLVLYINLAKIKEKEKLWSCLRMLK